MRYYKYILLILINISILFTQYGKNIVQYDTFDWEFIQTKNFDIYFYSEGEANIEIIAKYCEDANDKISELIGWPLESRSSIIIYNSHNDFQQTNVVDSYMQEGIGGVTELFKNRVVIPFDGSLKEFKHVIYHELVHVFINDGMYGGALKNIINTNTIMIPMWMNEGLAEYLSSKWDANSEMWIRDLAINYTQLPTINDLNGYLAYRGGQSIWNFITEKWGEESIAEIFFNIKSSGNLNKGVKNSIGIDINELSIQWQKYLKKEYWPDVESRDDIQDIARQITDHIELYNNYNIAPSPSPNGLEIAMYSNKNGEMGIYIISMIDGKFTKKLIKGNKTSEFEELHILKPGISWSPDGNNIVFSAKSGESDALFIKDINNLNVKAIKKTFNLEGIFRPAWNPQNNQIAFVGNNGMSSDIYIYNCDTDELNNITNDWFSDVQVSWHPNGLDLLIISDRGDHLKTGFRGDSINFLDHNVENLDIYKININEENLERLTDTPFNESYACYSPNGDKIAFISDESGINNIYVTLDENSSSYPITNIITGTTQLNWTSNNQLIFTGFYQSGYDIFILSNVERLILNSESIQIAKWKEKVNLPILKNYTAKKNKKNKYANFIFNENNINSQKYQVDYIDENLLKDSSNYYIKNNYTTRFTLDLAQAYYSYDSYYGSQGMAMFLFSDILGDHRIGISTEMQIDFKKSDYYFYYRYLKNKINHQAMFSHQAYRTNVYSSSEYNSIRYTLNRSIDLNYMFFLPFSRFSRIEGGITFNHLIKEISEIESSGDITNLSYNSYNLLRPHLKYVWDNTRWFYLYPVSGNRTYFNYEIVPKSNFNDYIFETFTMDSRTYFELSYTSKISVASRIYFGSSWGKNKRLFGLGGAPYIFSNNNGDMVNSNYEEALPYDDFYFMNNFIFPVRGFPMAQKYGSKALLMNYELRLPFLMYYFPTIKYLGQLFGVFFIDMGVAWNDKFPQFNNKQNWGINQNSDFTDNIGWIMSYGFGPRFIFLNMAWKLDYARQYDPIRGNSSNRNWYLTIGYDF
jgi:Tol biopolymer transport system component